MAGNFGGFKSVRTKIAGVMSGDNAETRQLGIRTIKEHWDDRPRWFLDLCPDPTNPYDSDCIRVMCDIPELGRTELGFVANREYACGFCKQRYAKQPRKDGEPLTQCPVCGSEQLHRDGLATQISKEMRDNPNESYYGEVLQITGGTEGKESMGVNFEVRRVYKKR